MKIKEILLSSAISAAATLAVVYILGKVNKHIDGEGCEPDSKITSSVSKESHFMDIPSLMPSPFKDYKFEMKPAEKKKIFDKFKPISKTIAANRLLGELEKRDVTITIHLAKGE